VRTGKGDAVVHAEANMSRSDMAGFVHFPGVGDHGMHDITMRRQPGRPHVRFRIWEAVRTTERRERGLIMYGESDRLIVPMKAGNAAGGKEATHERAT
jgi:hypothetical protein